MPWPEFFAAYALVLGSIVFGAFVARATGVGFALLLVAALLAMPHLDQPTVLYLVAPLSIFNLGIVALSLHRATPWGELRSLALPVFIGVIAGILLGLIVAKTWILVFGLLVVGYNLFTMLFPAAPGQTSAMANRWIGGGMTGVMTGGLSFPGPPISAFMLSRGYIGDPVRMAVAVTAISASLIRLAIGWPFMVWLPEFWQILACGFCLIVVGTILGTLAANRMSSPVHRGLIITLTFVSFSQLAWGLVRAVHLV